MSKVPKPGPEYSEQRETRVLLEDLRSQFKVFGEGLGDVQSGLENVQSQLKDLRSNLEDVQLQLSAVKQNLASLREEFTGFRIEARQEFSSLHKDLHSYDRRLSTLESAR